MGMKVRKVIVKRQKIINCGAAKSAIILPEVQLAPQAVIAKRSSIVRAVLLSGLMRDWIVEEIIHRIKNSAA